MASCSTCGASGIAEGSACPTCGSMPTPDLDVKEVSRPPARAVRPRQSAVLAPIELAVDPREIVQQRGFNASSAPPLAAFAPLPQVPGGPSFPPPHGALAMTERRPPGAPRPLEGEVADLLVDARVLADYPEAPRSIVLSPLYAWKVVKRQRALRAALAARKSEANHAQTALDDALEALAERVRPGALVRLEYAPALAALAGAEGRLRSCDQVLAAEQDAQRTRLTQLDARVARAESELATAQGVERAVATELAGIQSALAREEAKLKRAEVELRNSQERAAPQVAG